MDRMELHPQSHDFEWVPAGSVPRRISAEQARAYDEHGFFVLPDAFDAETVASITAEIDPLEAETEAYLRTREGGKRFIARAGALTFSVHLVKRSRRLREFCAGPVFRDLVHDLIGPDVRLYWDQSVYKKPGNPDEFPWHQDNGYTYIEPQQYLTCWVALTDTDESNGCPWVVPGIHRKGTLAHELTELGWRCSVPSAEAVPVPARAGSIVVFSSLTPHRTGPNRSSEVRKAYIVQFAPDGAHVRRGEPGSMHREPCDAPDRQFPVLVDGGPPRAD